MNSTLLEVRNVTKRFGGITAVDDCSFCVDAGTITGLIGPNGSGKTTVINIISGYLSPNGGDILFDDREVAGASPARMYRLGLSRTFQRARVFPQMTTMQNLLVAAPQTGWSLFRIGPSAETEQQAFSLLEDFRLIRLAHVNAGELSYGQQKLLEFATVLMASPRLLVLDEPTAGVNQVLIDIMVDRIRQLHRTGMTLVVIEHNMDFVMGLCDPIVVMDHGRPLYSGTPGQVQSNDLVLEAYLGG